jgi:hypothetical protein
MNGVYCGAQAAKKSLLPSLGEHFLLPITSSDISAKDNVYEQ